MKKRPIQKLVLVSVILFMALNMPLLLLFNSADSICGFPIIYCYVFSLWLLSAIVSFLIFLKYNE